MEVYYPQVEKLYKCEINAMAVMASDLQHPNVVHIHEIIDDIMENDKIIVAMEYCPGGQLLKWDSQTSTFIPDPEKVDSHGQLSEDRIKRVLWQTA